MIKYSAINDIIPQTMHNKYCQRFTNLINGFLKGIYLQNDTKKYSMYMPLVIIKLIIHYYNNFVDPK